MEIGSAAFAPTPPAAATAPVDMSAAAPAPRVVDSAAFEAAQPLLSQTLDSLVMQLLVVNARQIAAIVNDGF